MSDLKTSLNAIKDKNFGYFFDKDKCYIYHTKFGKERGIEIEENNEGFKFVNLNNANYENIQEDLKILENYKKFIKDFKDKNFKFLKDIFDEYKNFIYICNNINFVILKGAFEEYLRYYRDKDTIHIKFDKNTIDSKIGIKDKFNEIKEFDENNSQEWVKNFKKFWKKENIHSAQQRANASNLLNKKNPKELHADLVKISKVNSLEDLLNLDITGMKASARELAYLLNFENNNFPLVNDAMAKTAEYIFEMLNKNSNNKLKSIKENSNIQNNEQAYFDFVLKELDVKRTDNLPKYYILDQFLNLIDKIKKSDLALITKDKLQGGDEKYINNITESVYYKLYKAAYDFANLCGKADIKSNDLEGFKELLKTHKNIIFHGIPGTGKTYTIVNNVKNIIKNENQMLITQFHPSFSYEDFIEGIKPAGIENGQLKLELKNGIFREFCDKAKEEEKGFLEKLEKGNFNEALSDHGYFFIADEINRAELSRVFGELLYALEYRGEKGKIKTQYASMRDDEDFYVPENMFLLGTMNDLDKSIDSFDLALRRRFIWQEMTCDYGVIRDEIYANNIEEYAQACKKLNDEISKDIGEKYQLGHSYFLKIEFKNDEIKDSDMKKLFSNRFEALLKEYLRSEYSEKDIQNHLDELKKLFVIEKPNEPKK
ncbi:AAA family ATPase [Campylobacter sp. IFREMER_LSEM_CL908]|uniref:McrB family protein n=1 Tax=Campylobacter sp. IFREMER_LSEM_CL908 TaxID=2911624 RepID=UPI0021E8D175|nr:AAA family ATPase [Campylobacter sp. IFREMER_LSEM_CL908]MCV3393521.1 AAA family ATPase [Campylobacter sp. IFREMER_LSEM_CL908]